jgi:hypothetical protein
LHAQSPLSFPLLTCLPGKPALLLSNRSFDLAAPSDGEVQNFHFDSAPPSALGAGVNNLERRFYDFYASENPQKSFRIHGNGTAFPVGQNISRIRRSARRNRGQATVRAQNR